MDNNLFIGKNNLNRVKKNVSGKYVDIEGERYYKIEHYDQIPSFFMSLVSSDDHWMFISSNGGLTAGRKNPDNALFPYYTEDKIHDGNDFTGSSTLLFVSYKNRTYFWEPFSENYEGIYNIQRNIYKNVYGNKLIFEEQNKDFNLIFRYSWENSNNFGFIKHAYLRNLNDGPIKINILDGIENIMPYHVSHTFQNQFSILVNAYKKSELIAHGIGLYTLSSIPVDRAEPSEALKCTVTWSLGITKLSYLISSRQKDQFRKTGSIQEEHDVRAARGAYFINSVFVLEANATKDWFIIADVNQDRVRISQIKKLINNHKTAIKAIEKDIITSSEQLVKNVAVADGIQFSGDILSANRHFSNVLFNIMRGGIFHDHYNISKREFISYLAKSNKQILSESSDFVNVFPEMIEYDELLEKVAKTKNPHLIRLSFEYLPLTFSRRHGDPSRPWNLFNIDIKNEDGSQKLYYQGNWRDIFQNWEALSYSFPGFVEGMICRFVNASTVDGHNAYRITSDGIEWELLDLSDPWSNIGYWGDHQIIYLLKLLEISKAHQQKRLFSLLKEEIFVYANVPYRLKPYADMVKDPWNTIVFDQETEESTKERVRQTGSDGKLVLVNENEIYRVNLTEKILVSLLNKLTSFIPEAGIWMNTQRPEWNDANNALVGNGVSMVTLYYMYRHITFCKEMFSTQKNREFVISREVLDLFHSIWNIFTDFHQLLHKPISDREKRKIIDLLGSAGEKYRNRVYKGFSVQKEKIQTNDIISFFQVAQEYIEHSIKMNKRDDGLYHSYNLVEFIGHHELKIIHLYEMLEGQVALLSSGYLSPGDALELLKNMRKSALFRNRENSYLLYPDRDLPRFMQKNNIPNEKVMESELLQLMLDHGNTELVTKDEDGIVHFNGSFRNSKDVRNTLEELKSTEYKSLILKENKYILQIFEDIFNHQSFTGRSGTFYGYEGLGCIYWHMVSKLLLAVAEICKGIDKGDGKRRIFDELYLQYLDIKKGLGLNKSPEEYGAFPTDPYSHTPGDGRVRQPGMTGQVKEDIISRWIELGINIKDGSMEFKPMMLNINEFAKSDTDVVYYNLKGQRKQITLDEGALFFTYCQVPFIYHLHEKENQIIIKYISGKEEKTKVTTLSERTSHSIFSRAGEIEIVRIYITRNQVYSLKS